MGSYGNGTIDIVLQVSVEITDLMDDEAKLMLSGEEVGS